MTIILPSLMKAEEYLPYKCHGTRRRYLLGGGNAILTAPIEGRIENLGIDQMQNFLYTYIMILALYMVILLYGQMVATNVATEKSSRAMELLITAQNRHL